MRTLSLRYIHECSFTKSEETNYREAMAYLRRNKRPPRQHDVILLLSRGGDQMVFVHGFQDFESGGRHYHMLESHRLRLRQAKEEVTGDPDTYEMVSRRWNPLMLADYAAKVGIQLVGIKRFTEHCEASEQARRAGAR